MRSLALFGLALVLQLGAMQLGGCAAGSGMQDVDLAGQANKDGGGSGARCTAGDTQTCACLGGGQGTQTCRASGTSYGPCGGCGPEEEDGPLPILHDMGGSPCGDCDGCCNGAVCVPYASETNTSCGARGQSCATCGAKICDSSSGSCVDASGGCNASTCANGCCKMVNGSPTCFNNQPAACGTGGGACVACTYGVTCNGGCTTDIDSNAQFKVYVKQVVYYNTDTAGNCWDNYGGFGCADSDPQICFGYQSGGSIVEGCTTEIDNVSPAADGTVTVNYTDANGLVQVNGSPFLVPGTLWIQGGHVRISLYDIDAVNANDVIAQGYKPPVTKLVTPLNTGAYGRVKSLTFELR